MNALSLMCALFLEFIENKTKKREAMGGRR